MTRADPIQSEDSIHVLHVDDDPDFMLISKEFVRSFDPDLQIDSVSSPREAQEKMEKEEYDCIISDFKMPGMDGIQFAMRIREESNVPFILFTGQGSEEVAEAAFAVGVNDYLRKETNPSHYQVLAKRIRAAVEKHRAENALKESEGKYRSLVQNSRDGIMVFTGRELVYANPQAAALLDFSSVEELMKVGPDSRFHPEDRELIEERSLARERGESVSSISEIRLVLPDGTLRWVQSSSSVIEYSGKTSTLAFVRDTTERKRMEAALVEREERFRKVSELVSDWVYSTRIEQDGSYIPEWVTDGFTKFSGFKLEEITDGSVWEQHIFPEDSPIHIERLKAFRSNEQNIAEYRIITKDGEIRWVRDYGYPEWDEEENRVVRVYGAAQDITERKRMESRLRESETLYRELAEKSLDVMYRVDLEGRLQYISPAIWKVAGYNPEELMRKPFISFLPEDEIPKVSIAMQNALEGSQVQLFETKILSKDGSRVSIAVNSSPLRRDGQIVGFQGIIRDISEHGRMIEELRTSEERYRNLVELSPAGIMTFNFQGIVTSVNPAIERQSGFSPDELVGKHFSKLGYFRLQDIPRYTGIANSIVRGKIPPVIEFPYVHKNDTPKWAEAHIGFVYDRGRRIGIHVIVIDITDRKIVEKELLDHTSSLEELVERRSKELVEAEKMVTAGKIASMVGHDLRGPLSNIKNSLYLIERKPELAEKLKPMIFNSVDYALNMLEELRLSTRTDKPILLETNLGNLVQRAVNEAQIPPGVEVETQIGEGLASAQLDRTQLRRVLDNLIRNAVEAMPMGGTLVLSLEGEDEGLILKVEDSGKGMSEEEMSKIFEMFVTSKPKGMGLGLAYCKRAVEAHGGTITVVSEEGVGTTFTVRLPIYPE